MKNTRKTKISTVTTVALLFGSLAGGADAAIAVTSGLVGYWSGDGDANDTSGQGNHGTLNGGATFATGMMGQAFSLDGVDDWISTSQTLANDQSHSISAWISWNGHTAAANQEIVSWWDSGDPVASRTFLGTSQAPGQGPVRYGDAWQSVSATIPATGSWTHIVATYDGVTNNRELFINGVSEDMLASGAEARFGSLAIGRQSAFAGEYWNGLIDEVAIYDRVLTTSEVTLLSVPEPSSALLTGIAAMGLLLRRRR